MRVLAFLLVGAITFVAITFLEQIPVLGWLGGVVSIAAWVALTRAYAAAGDWDPVRYGARMTWAGIFGAWTGFVGALTAWFAQTGNLFGFTTPPGDRFGAAFGFVGASLGIVYWPIIGALVCAATAFAMTPRRSS